MFLVDEDFGDGLLPWQEGFGGEEVRPETSGRAPISPGILSKPPRSSSALGLVLRELLVSGGIPSVKHGMETSRNPAGRPGTVSWGGADPSHPTSIIPRRGQAAAVPSPALRQEPPERAEPASNGQRSPKTEFDGTAIPKRGSVARSSRRGSTPSSLLGESLALALGAAKKCP